MSERKRTSATGSARVVVVGHGMVAARLLDDLHRSDAFGADTLVLGEEPYEPYNRLMLSEVLAGRAHLEALTLPAPPAAVRTRRGCRAVAIDREARLVHTDDGDAHPYDRLVLATGARARIPDLPGLVAADGQLHCVRALRTMDDARDLVTTAGADDRVVTVIGGGLLGVEIACGLAGHGRVVELLHRGPHLLDRQLDPLSARVLAAALADLGIRVHTGVTPRCVERDTDQSIRAVHLDGGRCIRTGQIVLSAGVDARDELAQQAGLLCDRGVLVHDDQRSISDPRVLAIGDCARTPAGCPGLLAPGYAQAAAAARTLAADLRGAQQQAASSPAAPDDGARPDPATTRCGYAEADDSVVRLKALGVEALVLGSGIPHDEFADEVPRVVSLTDLGERRSIRVGIEDGRIVGACCVGGGQVAADLTQTFLRRLPVPLDAGRLLVAPPIGGARPVSDSPTNMPDSATVCRCNGVCKSDIVRAHVCGDRTVAQVADRTRAGTGCGGCRSVVEGLLEWMGRVDPDQGH